MNFTAEQLQKYFFKKKIFGGYKENEVNLILDKVIEDYSEMQVLSKELNGKIGVLEESLKTFEEMKEMLNSSLALAIRTEERIIQGAMKEAEIIKKDALREAGETLFKTFCMAEEIKNSN